jgi:hypothetical protein
LDLDGRNRVCAQSGDAVLILAGDGSAVPILTTLTDVSVLGMWMDGVPSTRSVSRLIAHTDLKRGSVLFESDIRALLASIEARVVV